MHLNWLNNKIYQMTGNAYLKMERSWNVPSGKVIESLIHVWGAIRLWIGEERFWLAARLVLDCYRISIPTCIILYYFKSLGKSALSFQVGWNDAKDCLLFFCCCTNTVSVLKEGPLGVICVLGPVKLRAREKIDVWKFSALFQPSVCLHDVLLK